MTLVPNWRRVLSCAWSVRFIIAAFLFSVLEIVLPALDGALPVPPGVFALLSGLTSAAAFVSRLVAQSSVSGANR
ncbi:hypothetical protein [Aureimonas sp. AU20]|uniref:DUF7940 domain-containing protein n=1 Tax=Aureimonas sp. AU20 TaxID=1349819 RepID=UPI00071F059E|nr:hypothetical protein [Aureimonas sp. AU20]ALN73517.1 hypothetical protein M673_12405 [Aureimonas sp. AU20]